MAKPKRPAWFKIYDSLCMIALSVDPIVAGKAFQAACAYFVHGEMRDLDPLPALIFGGIRAEIDKAFESYAESVENGRRGGLKKAENAATSTPSNPPLPLLRVGNRGLGSPTEGEGEEDVDEETLYCAASAKKTPRKRTRKAFIAPSLDEVKAYCKEKGYQIDAKQFIEYYSAADWHDATGKPVRNWKQRVISWASRTEPQQTAKPEPVRSLPIKIDPELLRRSREAFGE